MVIRVDVGSGLHTGSNKVLNRDPVSIAHDLVGFPILDSHDHVFPHASTPGQSGPFGFGHILPFSSHVGFIDLDLSEKSLASFFGPGFPNPVQHEPRGRL